MVMIMMIISIMIIIIIETGKLFKRLKFDLADKYYA